ncbi:polygalacturonase [Granulicella rosea]|uniref:Polygalacturonase n=1 Tax=Granulicella rosea TaxID=474952 RepID=A0A239LB92_9BACT|nr:glycosyl hydrolase family 28 protein [Granulicella rosea]SNT27103.1 polygalacturonase [Granulicella rosea]
MRYATCLFSVLLLAPVLAAQDSRNVTEPVIPPACATLDASLTRAGKTLAPEDEQRLDTKRIQDAMDHCGKGKGVVLRAHGAADAFLSGPLELRAGVALVVDKGVTLFESRDAALFAVSPGSCGLANAPGRGCKPLISAQHVSGASIMGDGVIDGRGGEKLLGRDVSPWDLAEQARPDGRQQVSRILVADYADNFTLYRITLRNSPNFHVTYNHGDGFTVWGLKIDTPKRLARNTDGVDPGGGSKNITITHSYIRTGDDNVAIKGGTGGLTQMTVSHNHFYWGHGMSIGSETNGGVSKIRVFDLSLDGPDNGIRIKSNGSRGGLTHDVLYDDVCVRNSPNPITFDTGYSAAGTLKGDLPPTMKDVTLHDIRVSGGGKFSFNGYAKQYRIEAYLDGVWVTDDAEYKYSVNHADLRLGPGAVNLKLPAGDDSTSSRFGGGTGAAKSCADKFVEFPAVE